MRISLPLSAYGFALALLAVLTGGLFALALPSGARAAEACPNEQVRAESDTNPATEQPYSLGLPECRAYEMVSPPLKNGSAIGDVASSGLGSSGHVVRVGAEGSTVLIASTGVWPGEQPANNDLLASGAGEAVQYRVVRGESGWGFKPEEPPTLRDFASALLPGPAEMSGDMATNGIWQGAGFAPAEEQIRPARPSLNPNFYLLEADGALAEVGPSVPPSDQGAGSGAEGGEVAAVAASANLSHMLFEASDLRWPFDQTKLSASEEISSLYEYVGTGHSGEGSDVPTLVGVDNTGALISQCGVHAGGYEGEDGNRRSEETGEAEPRSISAGGSTVFFTALAAGSGCEGGTGPAVDQLFARVGEPGVETALGSAVTVNVAGSAESGGAACASDSCNVTQAVKYQGASTDGSKVFFTSEQPLVAGDTDSTENLYECRLPGDSGVPPVRVAAVNPCPELVRVSVPGAGAGAEVQSVAAVSQDGSHVYFVAKGVLSGSNAEHKAPTEGQDNLYVWEAGHTAFIATLSSPAFGLGAAQATPDGDSLVFTSPADLTPEDTSKVAQVFLYEARHEALTWVSRGQNDEGETTTDPASLSRPIGPPAARPSEGRRVISEDGSVVVFESSAALTSQVHGGTHNVYLWRGGELYLISDGTPAGTVAAAAGGAVLSGLIGIDASGQNVFFTTEAQLVGQDSDDLSDLYDARVDGGFPASRVDECLGEECQGSSGATLAPLAPGSLSPSAQGNLAPAPPGRSKALVKPKSATRAQKLATALKACKNEPKKKRAKCEAAARKRYGSKAKAKQKAKKRHNRKSASKEAK